MGVIRKAIPLFFLLLALLALSVYLALPGIVGQLVVQVFEKAMHCDVSLKNPKIEFQIPQVSIESIAIRCPGETYGMTADKVLIGSNWEEIFEKRIVLSPLEVTGVRSESHSAESSLLKLLEFILSKPEKEKKEPSWVMKQLEPIVSGWKVWVPEVQVRGSSDQNEGSLVFGFGDYALRAFDVQFSSRDALDIREGVVVLEASSSRVILEGKDIESRNLGKLEFVSDISDGVLSLKKAFLLNEVDTTESDTESEEASFHLTAQGGVLVKKDALDLQIRVKARDKAIVDSLLPEMPDLEKGEVSFEVLVKGPYETPETKINFQASDLSLKANSSLERKLPENISFIAEYSFEKQQVQISDLMIDSYLGESGVLVDFTDIERPLFFAEGVVGDIRRKIGGRFALKGILDSKVDQLVLEEVSLRSLRLHDLLRLLEGLGINFLSEVIPQEEIKKNYEITLQGNLQALINELDIQEADIELVTRAPGYTDTFQIKASGKDSNVHLQSYLSAIQKSPIVDVWVRKGDLSGSVELRSLNSRRIPLLRKVFKQGQHLLTLTGKIGGNITDPELSAELGIESRRMRRRRAQNRDEVSRNEPSQAEPSQESFMSYDTDRDTDKNQQNSDSRDPSVREESRDEFLRGDTGRVIKSDAKITYEKGRLQLESDLFDGAGIFACRPIENSAQEYDCTIHLDDFPVRFFVTPESGKFEEVTFDGDLSFKGPFNDILSGTGFISIDEITAPEELSIPALTSAIEGKLQDRQFVLNPLTIHGADTPLVIKAAVSKDSGWNVSVQGQFLMDGLIQHVRFLESLAGVLEVDLTVRGAIDTPQMKGSIKIQDADFAFPLGEGIVGGDGIDGHISLSGTDIIIEQLKGSFGDGTFVIGGGFEDIFSSHLRSGDVSFKASQVRLEPIQGLTFLANINTDFSLSPYEKPLFSGTVNLDDAVYENAISIETVISTLTSLVLEGFSVRSKTGDALTDAGVNVDLKIAAPAGLYLDTNVLEAEFLGGVHLTEDLFSPRVSGEILVLDGEFSISQTDFRIISGRAVFDTARGSLNPTISLNSEGELRSLSGESQRIYMIVGGTLRVPRVRLSSDGFATQRELAQRLGVGAGGNQLRLIDEKNSRQAGLREVLSTSSDLSLTERFVGLTGIDEIRLETVQSVRTGELVPQVVAGRPIPFNLRGVLTSELAGDRTNAARVEYKLNEVLTTYTGWRSQSVLNPGATSAANFLLGIRFDETFKGFSFFDSRIKEE